MTEKKVGGIFQAADHYPDYPVIAVLASDWSFFEDQYDEDAGPNFDLMDVWSIGLLIYEDDDKVVISSSYFPRQEAIRHISVISKSSIIKRIDFNHVENVGNI